MPAATTARVRTVLKRAGLAAAKKTTSSNVRSSHGMGGNYSRVTAAGFALANETDYRRDGEGRKRHIPTGRVVVSFLENGFRPDADATARDIATATAVLTAAGFTVASSTTCAFTVA